MTKMIDQPQWFKDCHGELFQVTRLSPSIAKKYQKWLIDTHNEIPFQHWTDKELFATADETRSYLGKWEISQIALSAFEEPLAFCIGFEMNPDNIYYHETGVYLHRLAVARSARGKMIGALLQTETIFKVFLRGLCFVGDPRTPVVIFGQTNKTTTNNRVRLFHRAAGFQEVGEKQYSNRVDVVMKMDATDFWSSRHVCQWRSARIQESESVVNFSLPKTISPQSKPDEHAFQYGEDYSQTMIAVKMVKVIINMMTGIPVPEILDSDDLSELLAPDSLLMAEFWLTVEQRIGLEFVEGKIEQLGRVIDVANFIAQRIGEGRNI